MLINIFIMARPTNTSTIAVFTRLCTAREITFQESVNARVRVHTINIGTKKLEFLSTDDVNSWMSTESIAWPQVARWKKIGSECNCKQTNMMVRFQHRPMRNAKFSQITCLISCCSIHVGQLRWFAGFTSSTQWRSQGLPGWATRPPGRAKWGRK